MRRYALRDDPGKRIEHLLPGRPGSVGVIATRNRGFVKPVLFRYRATLHRPRFLGHRFAPYEESASG